MSERDYNAEAATWWLKTKLKLRDWRMSNEDQETLIAAVAWGEQIAAEENERLNNKFACGHRKIDWDDSYGECVFCKIKAQANDYESLPHDVIACHDKIEELQSDLAAARESLKEWIETADLLSKQSAGFQAEAKAARETALRWARDHTNMEIRREIDAIAAKLEGK